MLLRLNKVARFYGSRLIFKDVSMSLQPGTVTLLAGANGAGKSTLIKIMAGLIRPSAGTVTLGKRPQNPDTAPEKSGSGTDEPRLAYLGHQTFLYPELSALENLRFWSALYQRPCSDAALMDALGRVELDSFAADRAGGFSRGMAQRLNLARVFLLCPDILLLDEPCTGLDTRSTGILHQEIEKARASGAGIVWITHSPAADLHRADMLAVLEGKTLRFYGKAEQYPDQDESARAPFSTPVLASGGEVC